MDADADADGRKEFVPYSVAYVVMVPLPHCPIGHAILITLMPMPMPMPMPRPIKHQILPHINIGPCQPARYVVG